jgi:hypothetical protein
LALAFGAPLGGGPFAGAAFSGGGWECENAQLSPALHSPYAKKNLQGVLAFCSGVLVSGPFDLAAKVDGGFPFAFGLVGAAMPSALGAGALGTDDEDLLFFVFVLVLVLTASGFETAPPALAAEESVGPALRALSTAVAFVSSLDSSRESLNLLQSQGNSLFFDLGRECLIARISCSSRLQGFRR